MRRLHRAKDAAYRNSWKKRGEVMSIIANIARKVDRLENIASGAPATSDESILDTAVDLLVYTLKYQTYLADQDTSVATTLFQQSGAVAPYSDGPNGFEVLLARQDMTTIEQKRRPRIEQAAQGVLNIFDELEVCFRGILASAERRATIAAMLGGSAVTLIGSVIRDSPERYRDFLMTGT